jgi:hypothetical protein
MFPSVVNTLTGVYLLLFLDKQPAAFRSLTYPLLLPYFLVTTIDKFTPVSSKIPKWRKIVQKKNYLCL